MIVNGQEFVSILKFDGRNVISTLVVLSPGGRPMDRIATPLMKKIVRLTLSLDAD